MPAVSIASRRCSGPGPSVRISFGATEPTPGSSRRPRAAATKPGVQEAVGLHEQHGVAVHGAHAPRSSRARTSGARRGARSARRAPRPPPRSSRSEALSITTTSTSSCASAVGSEWRSSSASFGRDDGDADPHGRGSVATARRRPRSARPSRAPREAGGVAAALVRQPLRQLGLVADRARPRASAPRASPGRRQQRARARRSRGSRRRRRPPPACRTRSPRAPAGRSPRSGWR